MKTQWRNNLSIYFAFGRTALPLTGHD